MTTITQEVTIPADHRLTVELPPDFPIGSAVVTVVVQPGDRQPKNRAREVYGKGKGKVWMSDDFDAPLEDFAEYM